MPLVEEEADSGISRLLFNFLKCSSRHCISFSSVISDGGGGSWPGRISSCSFGRAANPVRKLDHKNDMSWEGDVPFANLRNALCDRDMDSGPLSFEANPAT